MRRSAVQKRRYQLTVGVHLLAVQEVICLARLDGAQRRDEEQQREEEEEVAAVRLAAVLERREMLRDVPGANAPNLPT